MSTIVTRAGKGSALTHTEVDANFTNLNTDKLQVASGGLNSTVAELNKVDDSAAAVSGYVSGMRTYLHADGANATTFDVDANVTEDTFESVGPTGSGADNEWAAMDDITATARIARIGVVLNYDPVNIDTVAGVQLWARGTGGTAVIGDSTLIVELDLSPDDDVTGENTAFFMVDVPLDASRRFDLAWNKNNATLTLGITLYLKGFIL